MIHEHFMRLRGVLKRTPPQILTENVRPKRTYNFVKYEDYLVDPRDVEYDYYSIMHYR